MQPIRRRTHVKINSELTQVLKLADKDISYYKCNLYVPKVRDTEDIEKTQIKLLQMKTTVCDENIQ